MAAAAGSRKARALPALRRRWQGAVASGIIEATAATFSGRSLAQEGTLQRAARILIVDDSEQNLVILTDLVRSLGHEVETARDGLEALTKLSPEIDLLLLDVMMPGLDGYAVARRLRADAQWRDLPVIMVTVLNNQHDRLLAVEAGANDFIGKPVDSTELRLRIESQLHLKEARDVLKRSHHELEEEVAQRTAELRRALADMVVAKHHIYDAHVDTIHRLVFAAELKDAGTAQHIKRLSRYSGILADALRLAPGDAEVLSHAVTMHDVGKIGIPDAILSKPGQLTAEERRIMESHTLIGARILEGSPSALIEAGRIVALTHHERWDGSGYPHGLAGDRIPLWGRICAVIDVFDALTTRRPYREPMPIAQALALVAEERGRHFDPALADHFLAREDAVLALHGELSRMEPAVASVVLLPRRTDHDPDPARR
jgi:putative two-component system response regulator